MHAEANACFADTRCSVLEHMFTFVREEARLGNFIAGLCKEEHTVAGISAVIVIILDNTVLRY